MCRRTRVILIIVAAVVCGAVLIGPRLFRCYAYYRLVVCSPCGLANLSGKVSKLNIPFNSNMPVFSLGYAQFGVRPDSISTIKCTMYAGTEVVMVCDEYKILFVTPSSSNWPSTDSNSVPSPFIPSIFSEDPFGYNFGVRAASATSKGYAEIFFLHPRKFAEYLTLAAAKSQNVMNQNGIGVFQTEYVHGLVRFGQIKNPGCYAVQVFAEDSNICQDIYVISNEPEKSKQVLLSLLASYKFLIDEVPDEGRLHELIRTQLEKHDKFQVGE